MAKLPSMHIILQNALSAVLRFPEAILFVICGTFCAYLLTGFNLCAEDVLIKLLCLSLIGVPLMIAVQMISELKELKNNYKILIRIIAWVLLFIYLLTLSDVESQTSIIRLLLFVLVAHLLVSAGSFLFMNQRNAFWQFNKTLFLHFLTALLYSTVLILGLFLAVLSIDQLFNADIEEEVYIRIWIVIIGVFNTLFFLTGIPKDPAALEKDTDYPKGLKVFTQFVLLPLVSIYLLILYTYILKIIATWNIPQGWVSYLVISFSAVGIFSILLIHPVRDMPGNKWIRTYSRLFYFLLLPLLVLLFISIGIRINQYGITENRYVILVIALVLSWISAYFIFRRSGDILMIPVSLAVMAILISAGPWGIFSVSKHSQKNQLKHLLEKNKILVDGEIMFRKNSISSEDHKRISDIMWYLDVNHDLSVIRPWFGNQLDSLSQADTNEMYYSERSRMFALMNLNDYTEYSSNAYTFKTYYAENKLIYHISGFDYVMLYNYRSWDKNSLKFKKEKKSYEVYFDAEKPALLLEEEHDIVCNLEFDEYINKLRRYKNEYTLPDSLRVVSVERGPYRMKILFDEITLHRDSSTTEMHRFDGKLFIKTD